MAFEIKLPEEFSKAFEEQMEILYRKAIDEAKRDYNMNNEILSINEVMQWTSSSRNTVMGWGKLGLPISKIEGKYFIRKSHLLKFIDSYQINQTEI